MIKKRKLPLVLCVAILLHSCISHKYINTSTSPTEISSLDYFEPYAYIHLIEKGNKPRLNDSLSMVSTKRIDSVLISQNKKFRIKNKIVVSSKKIEQIVENEFNFLIQSAVKKRKLANIPLTPTIDSILEARNQRFAMGIIGTGFGRKKGNYGGQVAKGVAVGVLTLGLFAPIPIKSNLTLYAIIVDSQKNEVTFYNNTNPIEKPPTDPVNIEKQLYKLFDSYLFLK